MKAKQILEEHPKSALIVNQYYSKKLIESIESFNKDDDFKKFLIEKGVEPEQIEEIVENGSRILVDLFDDYKIYISIMYNKGKFKVDINGELIENTFLDRKSAEHAAMIKSFTKLEEILVANSEEEEKQEKDV